MTPTKDSITDEHIEELRVIAERQRDGETLRMCGQALRQVEDFDPGDISDVLRKDDARRICAELINGGYPHSGRTTR